MSDPIFCDCKGPDSRIGGECRVLVEFRQYKTPEGRAHLRDAYLAQLRARGEQRSSGNDPRDLPARLSKLGVPGQAVIAATRPQETKALEAARRFLSVHRSAAGAFTPCLALIGSVGVGKTVAAVHVLQDFCRKYEWDSSATGETTPPAMFVPAASLSNLVQFEPWDQRRIRDMKATRLLVLDDCGDEATEFSRAAVHDVLKSRLDANRQTVFTSNLSGEKFRERYGSDLADRLNAKAIAPNLGGTKSLRTKHLEAKP